MRVGGLTVLGAGSADSRKDREILTGLVATP